MPQWSAPWNAPKKSLTAVIKPVQEIVVESAPIVEAPVPAPVVEETPVVASAPVVEETSIVEEIVTKKVTKKVEPTSAK
jgi:hypothetical protein